MFSTDLTNTSWKRANTIWKQQRAIFRNHQKARVPVLSVSPKKRRTSHLCQAKEPQNMALGETCSKAQRCTKAGHKSKRQLKMHYCSHCPEPSEQRTQLSSPQLAKHLFFQVKPLSQVGICQTSLQEGMGNTPRNACKERRGHSVPGMVTQSTSRLWNGASRLALAHVHMQVSKWFGASTFDDTGARRC